jgi:hypothetical protein
LAPTLMSPGCAAQTASTDAGLAAIITPTLPPAWMQQQQYRSRRRHIQLLSAQGPGDWIHPPKQVLRTARECKCQSQRSAAH